MSLKFIALKNKEAGFATCELCGALVFVAEIQRHEDWHEKLRRAVDEADSPIGRPEAERKANDQR